MRIIKAMESCARQGRRIQLSWQRRNFGPWKLWKCHSLPDRFASWEEFAPLWTCLAVNVHLNKPNGEGAEDSRTILVSWPPLRVVSGLASQRLAEAGHSFIPPWVGEAGGQLTQPLSL
jgi:hypothetical protein